MAEVLGVEVTRRAETASRRDTLWGMTAKEQVLKEVSSWSEAQAAAALRVVYGGVDPDLAALLEEEGDEILAGMDAREDDAARRASKA